MHYIRILEQTRFDVMIADKSTENIALDLEYANMPRLVSQDTERQILKLLKRELKPRDKSSLAFLYH